MKLKPCPTCGESEYIRPDKESDNDWWVECPYCGTRISFRDTKIEAIDWWNKRPAEDELVEALEEVILKIHLLRNYRETFPAFQALDPTIEKIKNIISKYKGGDVN